jgi:hypothetical protein
MKILLFSVCLLLTIGSLAQKNMEPASRADQLNIELPPGSKRDARLLSVSAAKWLLETEAARVNLALLNTEVYLLPAVSASGFDAVKLDQQLQQAGWASSSLSNDRKFRMLRKGEQQVILYFDMAKKSTDLYLAGCSTKAQTDPQVPQPVTVVHSQEPVRAGSSSQDSLVRSPLPVVPGQSVSSIEGTWSYSISSAWSINDPAGSMSSGYTTHQYSFHPGGLYTFYTKQFLTLGNDILLVRENGKYIEKGNQLELIPQKSYIETWNKKDGTDRFGILKSSVPRELEPVVYTFTKYYFQGLQEWSLVLQAARPTKREGPFSTNDLFSNAYYYRPISSTNTPIELPVQ